MSLEETTNPNQNCIEGKSIPNKSNFKNGRWTEKEHYYFLLAVKEYGKDWKKIEGIVKTRSSTQSRSHAQKVLNDDLMNKLDSEIQRLSLKYNTDNFKTKNITASFPKPKNLQTLQTGVRGKKIKRVYKEAIKRRDIEQIEEMSNISSENYEVDSRSEEIEEDYLEDKEYSSFDNSKVKLFLVQKVKKPKTSKRKRRVRVKVTPDKLCKEIQNMRKDSAITNVSSMSASMLSPAKTCSTTSLTPNIREKNKEEKFRIIPFVQNGGLLKNKKGDRGDTPESKPHTEMRAPKTGLGLQRAVSLKTSSNADAFD